MDSLYFNTIKIKATSLCGRVQNTVNTELKQYI